MRYLFLLLTLIILFLPRLVKVDQVSSNILQQDEELNVTISSPVHGQTVQGAVVIRGNTRMDGYLSSEVDFAYAADPLQTWFLIQESTLHIQDGVLAVWDTTTITDGDYNLRLVITRIEGENVEVSVPGLRVRNYTPIETDTLVSTPPHIILAPGVYTLTVAPPTASTPASTSLPPTPAPLPTNPAKLSASQVILTFGKSAAFTIGIFAILGAYIGLRTALHKRK